MRMQLVGIEQFVDGAISEVIRPAAIVPEEAARAILAELRGRSVENNGCWVATAQRWSRYDGPGVDAAGTPLGQLIGVIEAVYGASTRYEVTLYRVTVTPVGTAAGWTIDSLCDEPLAYGGLTLASCPRAKMLPPPKPFRHLSALPRQNDGL
jgi:hypothetical protein